MESRKLALKMAGEAMGKITNKLDKAKVNGFEENGIGRTIVNYLTNIGVPIAIDSKFSIPQKDIANTIKNMYFSASNKPKAPSASDKLMVTDIKVKP